MKGDSRPARVLLELGELQRHVAIPRGIPFRERTDQIRRFKEELLPVRTACIELVVPVRPTHSARIGIITPRRICQRDGPALIKGGVEIRDRRVLAGPVIRILRMAGREGSAIEKRAVVVCKSGTIGNHARGPCSGQLRCAVRSWRELVPTVRQRVGHHSVLMTELKDLLAGGSTICCRIRSGQRRRWGSPEEPPGRR